MSGGEPIVDVSKAGCKQKANAISALQEMCKRSAVLPQNQRLSSVKGKFTKQRCNSSAHADDDDADQVVTLAKQYRPGRSCCLCPSSNFQVSRYVTHPYLSRIWPDILCPCTHHTSLHLPTAACVDTCRELSTLQTSHHL
eukprot:67506-Chlamydomonas_euryale.AAC.9